MHIISIKHSATSTRPEYEYTLLADLELLRLESWSRDPFLQVLVSVLNLGVLVLDLEPQSLGLETAESWSWSWISKS